MKPTYNFNMPKDRKPQADVLFELIELSNETDKFITESVSASQFPGLDDWFDAAINFIAHIRDCSSIESIKHPPPLSVFLGEENKRVANVDTAVPEAQRQHVHDIVQSEATNRNVNPENSKLLPTESCPTDVNAKRLDNNNNTKSNKGIVEDENFLPVVVLQQISTPVVENLVSTVCVSKNNTCSSQTLMQTPIFNTDTNKTLILDSAPSSICQKTKTIITTVYNDSGIKIKPNSKHLIAKKLMAGSIGMTTRSGSKRKSSTSTSESKTNKKKKYEVSDVCINSSSKTTRSKNPLADKNTRTGTCAPENKAKAIAVIVPTKKKTSVVSKEEQIREELKKKEEKANETIKRVLAERQMKAEQTKKNREAKREKTLQKRMQMEKEKEMRMQMEKEREERLQKAELDHKKSQAKAAIKENVKNGVIKSRTQELIEQHTKATTSRGVLSSFSSKENNPNGNVLVKTPIQKMSEIYDNYELTPLPNSSTYNFSDDEEDEGTATAKAGKHIPAWALGAQFKTALIHQYYNPPDIVELFGKEIDAPNLTEIFSVTKKHYQKRTSSAVWESPSTFRH